MGLSALHDFVLYRNFCVHPHFFFILHTLKKMAGCCTTKVRDSPHFIFHGFEKDFPKIRKKIRDVGVCTVHFDCDFLNLQTSLKK